MNKENFHGSGLSVILFLLAVVFTATLFAGSTLEQQNAKQEGEKTLLSLEIAKQHVPEGADAEQRARFAATLEAFLACREGEQEALPGVDASSSQTKAVRSLRCKSAAIREAHSLRGEEAGQRMGAAIESLLLHQRPQ